MRTRPIAFALVAFQLHASLVWAYDLGAAKEQPAPSLTSEFIYRNFTEEALIPVYLLGAVAKPGLYHVPSTMDVVGLLTVAGGPTTGAQTDRILIKGQGGGKSQRQIRFSLEDSITSSSASKVTLASNDVVYVTPGKTSLSTDILTAIGIITGIVGIVASGFLIGQAVK